MPSREYHLAELHHTTGLQTAAHAARWLQYARSPSLTAGLMRGGAAPGIAEVVEHVARRHRQAVVICVQWLHGGRGAVTIQRVPQGCSQIQGLSSTTTSGLLLLLHAVLLAVLQSEDFLPSGAIWTGCQTARAQGLTIHRLLDGIRTDSVVIRALLWTCHHCHHAQEPSSVCKRQMGSPDVAHIWGTCSPSCQREAQAGCPQSCECHHAPAGTASRQTCCGTAWP